jgi:hypothetical protein
VRVVSPHHLHRVLVLTCPPCTASEEDLNSIKSFLSRFKTQPGKRRGGGQADPNVDLDDDEGLAADAAPTTKYLDMLVSPTLCSSSIMCRNGD